MPEPKRRDLARISVNKLGEYIVANPIRRRSIIKDQKKPRTIYIARYTRAETEIQNYIVNDSGNIEHLAAVARELVTADYPSDWKRETAELCSKALYSFIKVAGDIPAEGLLRQRINDNVVKMEISKVAVSVRPEILLAKPNAPDEIIGGIKLYFSKTAPLEKGTGEFIASIVYRYIAEYISTEAVADYKKCFVLDVFTGHIFVAPKSYKNHMKYAQAACDEIAALWPTVSV